MKVSLWLPVGSANPRPFLYSEISQARNIKDKSNRKDVIRALQKILVSTSKSYEGKAFFSDGNELIIESYKGIHKHYFCGREYDKPVIKAFDPYLLVVIDAQEAAIGTTDGERIKVLWTDTSLVSGKHSRGGQSSQRFQRGHEEELKRWMRDVAEIAVSYFDNQNIIIGGAGMTKDKFIEELPSWLQKKIVRISSVGYTDENGLWELMGISRYS